jgi:3'-phosphoadenosine 5'-phosphosulfate sulfotransferase (PAPS reductase)/FAD synthetase
MRVLFASYGNDSIALIQFAHEAGWDGVTVLHTDTGWAAPGWKPRVLEAEEWVRSLGFTAARTKGETMEQLVERKKAWPRGGGRRFQFCTEALKEAPAVAWLEEHDPEKDAICLVGIRREESANRTHWPEWTPDSPKHGGRDLYAPLVRHTEAMRNDLIRRTPMPIISGRSKECYPCVNANKGELKWLDEPNIIRVERIEEKMGINGKGNARVMFSPARHGGAIGIRAVVEDSKHDSGLLFEAGCDSGWCGS